jgi:hypothetical protein
MVLMDTFFWMASFVPINNAWGVLQDQTKLMDQMNDEISMVMALKIGEVGIRLRATLRRSMKRRVTSAARSSVSTTPSSSASGTVLRTCSLLLLIVLEEI